MAKQCFNRDLMNGSGGSSLPSQSISNLFNAYELARYNRFTDYIIGEIFRKYIGEKGWTVTDLRSKDNLPLIYQGVKDFLFNILRDYSSDDYQNPIWKNLSDKAVVDIDTIYENFDTFSEQYSKYSSIFKTGEFNFLDEAPQDNDVNQEEESEEKAEDQEEEEENKGKDYDKIGNEKSQFELSSSDVKSIFRLVPKAAYNATTKKVELVLDIDGLPTIANASATWNLLASKLTGAKDDNHFRELLLSEKTKQVVPEVQFINEIIKTEKQNKSFSEARQFVAFYQSFSKPKVPIKSSFTSSEKNFDLNDEILGNFLKIQNDFNNNFVEGRIPEEYKKYVKTSTSGVNYLWKDGDDYIPPYPETFNDRVKFLEFIGIRFSGTQFFDVHDQLEYEDIVSKTSIRLYNSLKQRLDDLAANSTDLSQAIKEPVKQLRKRYSRLIPSEKDAIDRIIEFEGRWSRTIPTHSSRNILGELQHLIMNDSALSMTTYHLNFAKTIDQLYETASFKNSKHNPNFRNSYIINFLFDKEGNKIDGRTINLELISGDKIQTSGKNITRIERQMSKSRKLVQDYNMFLLKGRTDVMRTETSHSFYMLGLYDGKNSRRYLNPKGFGNSFFESREFKNQIANYLNGEIARINSYDKKKSENPNLPATYKEFSIFSEVFDNGQNGDIASALLKEGSITTESELFTKFFTEYEKVLNAEFEKFKRTLDDNNITDDILLSKSLKEMKVSTDALHRAFIAGTLIQNIEFSILYTGDTLFYKDMHKRLKGMSSTGNIAADLALIQEYLNSDESKTFDGKYSLFSALGKKRRDNSTTFRTQVLTEYPIRPGFAYLDPKMPQAILDSIILRDGGSGIYNLDYIKELLSGAKDQKPADGEGYINLDFHRELSIRFGFSTPETEIAYKYEGLIFRKDILGKQLSTNDLAELAAYEKQIYSNPDKYALPILKMTYWGGIDNTTIDAKAYDKFSVMPILPSHARNGHVELQKIMLDMANGGYGYVKYESGTKLYKRVVVNELGNAEPDLYYTPLLKEQIKTNSEQSTDTSIPTQMLKLIFANLFNQGVPKTERAKEIYDQYIAALSNIQKEQVDRTLRDLGISFTNKDGKISITSINAEELSERLIAEAKRQQMNSNIIESLQINPDTKQFRRSAESSGFQKQINDLIAGILDRNLRRFKFPGGDFVLATNANHSKLGWYKFDKAGTVAAECRITLTKEYTKMLNKTHPDGKPIATILRLNKLLKNKDWVEKNKKSLTIVLDRVPTQGPNSMDFATIVEFLPPTMGNVVILPDEIVFKSGTDFDYDKEKVLTPNFDENGEYLTADLMDRITGNEKIAEILNKLQELQDIYPELQKFANLEKKSQLNPDDLSYYQRNENSAQELIDKIFDTSARKELFEANVEARELIREYYSLTREPFHIKNNRIIEIYKDILSAPEMFAELMIPNTNSFVKKIARDNAVNTDNQLKLPERGRVYYHSENLDVYKMFFDAKGLLGAFATDNTFQQLMTYLGININEVYNTKKFSSWVPERINNLLLTPEEKPSVFKGDKIMTSLREDVLGYIKQHINSENINATVDAAKDPFFSTLRILWGNIGVVNLLKNQGVPFKRIVDFINHPTLQYFFSLTESGMKRKDAIELIGRERLSLRSFDVISRATNKADYSLYSYESTEKLIERGLLNPNETVAVNEYGKRILKKTGDSYSVDIQTVVYPNQYTMFDIFREVDSHSAVTIKGYENINKWINYNPISPERFEFLARPENDRQIVKQDPERKTENIPLYSDEIRIFSHFIMMDRVNYAFRDFHKYFNFDTTKTSTNLDVRLKRILRRKIIDQKLFSESDIVKMETRSILSPYMNGEIIETIYNSMFPVLAKPLVQNYLTQLYAAYDSPQRFEIKNKRDLRNMPKVLSNDFLTSVMFSFGKTGEKNLFDRGKELLIRSENKVTMVDRLVKFRKQPFYKEVAEKFPILERFISNKLLVVDPYDLNGMTNPFIIENVQFIKNPNETLLEQEEVIEQLRDLYYTYNHPDEKVNTALKSFMEDLFIAGIVQSGLSKTFIGYEEYIPVQFKSAIYDAAVQEFKKLDDNAVKEYMTSFYWAFMNNNPKYFPWYKYKDPNSKKNITVNNGNKYWNRIKFLKMPVPPSTGTFESPTPTVSPEAPVTTSTSSEKINIYAGSNENKILSNLADRPFRFSYGDSYTDFDNVEQAYQSTKHNYSEQSEYNDLLEEKILETDSGFEAKKLGAKFKGLRKNEWDKDSSRIMKDFIRESFKQNPEALKALLATGNAELTHTQDKGKWRTEFPKILMEIRQELSTLQGNKVITDDNAVQEENEGEENIQLENGKDIKIECKRK